MSEQSNKAHCVFCRKEVTYHINPVNHTKHMLLTILTIGLWTPIWLSLSLTKVKVCDICNNAIPEDAHTTF